MKATLEFTLPADDHLYNKCLKANDMCEFLFEFYTYLRNQKKYNEEPDDIDKIFEKWFEIMNNINPSIHDLYT